jgi:hypothetical protein
MSRPLLGPPARPLPPSDAPSPVLTRPRALQGTPGAVSLALVAVAAADQWAQGAGLPAPRAWVARRILAACARVQRRHHVLASGFAHGRAVAALDRIADGVNACPAPTRPAVLCAVLLDLLNDRPEDAFRAVSDELTRLDRELVRVDGAEPPEAVGARIAEGLRRGLDGAA